MQAVEIERSARPDSIENPHVKVEPCRFHGCPADVAVITNWPCYDHTEYHNTDQPDRDSLVMVTLQGWVEQRCPQCAIDMMLWPPPPKEDSWRST